MALRIEDYALIGDLRTGALVGRDGSIDWLCLPRFDAGACFAALLGTPDNGRWLLAPVEPALEVTRRYRDDALIVETTFRTAAGSVRLIDFMPIGESAPTIVRVVEGVTGHVEVALDLKVRYGYGDLAPWTVPIEGGCTMTAVGDALVFRSDRPFDVVDHDLRSGFGVGAGQRIAHALSWYPSHAQPPPAVDALGLLEATETWWRHWSVKIGYDGPAAGLVRRSATILKALFSEPYGASVAAVTTSLPEQLGGDKNWDYRYAWVRDSCFTVDALLHVGMVDEAWRWRDWVLRALAGRPSKLQIMYGVNGRRFLNERTIAGLSGYEGSLPVRVGNAAYSQFQLGVYGQAMAVMYEAHSHGVPLDATGWEMLTELLAHVEAVWEQPDAGIWESRAAPQHHTHSKVEAWRAFDFAVRMTQEWGYRGDAARWAALAERIRAQVCTRGYHPKGFFTQTYDSDELDASLLLMPLIGFLPPDDPRIVGTLRAIESRLLEDGFVYRTSNDPATAETTAERREGVFLACNFWLVENYVQQGRLADAQALFARLCGLATDLGLLTEEYDPRARRLLGNIPQTFSHAALINAAVRLREASGAAILSAARER